MNGPAIATEGIQHRYEGGARLDFPDLEVADGESVALLGGNGSGKSTLLQVLALLLRPSAGRVRLLGQTPWTGGNHLLALRRQVTLIHQRPVLFRTSVRGNLALGLRERRLSSSEIDRRIDTQLDRVGLAGFQRRPAKQLSGGEAQRVVLARALVLETPVLLLDEPTSYLDVRFRPMLEDLLRERQAAGTTLVVATHDASFAEAVGDRHIPVVDDPDR